MTYLARRIHTVARHGAGRWRLRTAFDILGVHDDPLTTLSFDNARRNWIAMARSCRETGETDREKAANVAWQHLKDWRCPVCGGVKKRVKSQTCGNACGDKLRRDTRLKRLGPVILRLNNQKAPTGNRYRGHALRRAQLTTLRNALAKCNHCVAEAARELGMSYGTIKYYIRKFGGYMNGQRKAMV